jgi:hypothetical protein
MFFILLSSSYPVLIVICVATLRISNVWEFERLVGGGQLFRPRAETWTAVHCQPLIPCSAAGHWHWQAWGVQVRISVCCDLLHDQQATRSQEVGGVATARSVTRKRRNRSLCSTGMSNSCPIMVSLSQAAALSSTVSTVCVIHTLNRVFHSLNSVTGGTRRPHSIRYRIRYQNIVYNIARIF